MGKGAIAVGIVCILSGIYFTYLLLMSNEPRWLLIHISILIGVGIALIILYKEEDKIEERKDLKKK